MPTIDVTQKVLDLEGEPIKDPPKKPGDPQTEMTIRSACIQALMNSDAKATGDEKFRAFMLAQRFHEEDNPHFDSKEITTIKNAVGKLFVPVVIGFVWNVLDPPKPKEVPPAKEETPATAEGAPAAEPAVPAAAPAPAPAPAPEAVPAEPAK